MGDKGRQDFGKADAAYNTGTHICGDHGRQWKAMGSNGKQGKHRTSPRKGGHLLTQVHMWGDTIGGMRDTRGDKTSERQMLHPTQASMRKERQGEARRERRGDKGRQDVGKADPQPNTGTHAGRQYKTMGQEETRPRADAPSNKGKQEEAMGDKGRQDPGEGGHTIQHQAGHLEKAFRTLKYKLFGGT